MEGRKGSVQEGKRKDEGAIGKVCRHGGRLRGLAGRNGEIKEGDVGAGEAE